MLTLYYKPTCPFSRRVMAVIDRLELEVDMKDVGEDEAAKADLLEKGGKTQTPYLIDTEHEFSDYESDDIVAHLQKHYGDTDAAAAGKPRVHVSDATCTSCEG